MSSGLAYVGWHAAAAFATGLIVGAVYVGLLWSSTQATILRRSMAPLVVGLAARIVLLSAFGGALVMAEAGPVAILAALAGLVVARGGAVMMWGSARSPTRDAVESGPQ